MLEKELVEELKEKISMGAAKSDPDDVLKVFELYKQISGEIDYLKKDTEEENMIGQISYTDHDVKYWINASNGKVDYGKGNIENPLFSISASKEIVMGLFFGELDANIISPLGKLKASGNLKNLRAFQEFYEDAMEEFKKIY